MGIGVVGGGGMGRVVRIIPCFGFIIMEVNHKLHGKWCFCHLLSTKMDNEYTQPNPDNDDKNQKRRESEEPIRVHPVSDNLRQIWWCCLTSELESNHVISGNGFIFELGRTKTSKEPR